MEDEIWDCVIVGAGIMGSWAAYHLSKQGGRTLLLEQFLMPHSRGGSNGQSRIIRMAYDKERYACMMPEAFSWWQRLEEEAGMQLFVKTGLVKIQGGDQSLVRRSYQSMLDQGQEAELLDGAALGDRYPAFGQYPRDYRAVVDPAAGLLLPPRCLQALQKRYEGGGVRVVDGAPVESIQPGGPGGVITLFTPRGRYRARRLILTPGPWAKDLLAKIDIHVPIKTMPGRSCYWKIKKPGMYSVRSGTPIMVHHFHWVKPGENRHVYMIPSYEYTNMAKTMPGKSAYWKVKAPNDKYSVKDNTPIFLHHMEPPFIQQGYRFYALFPALEYPGMVKIVTRGEPPPSYLHPDSRDSEEGGEMVKLLSEYITKYFPDIENKPSIIEPCVYSMTPDSDYIIDHHPKYPNIVFGCGFSGHGFKLAPVVGKILVNMVHGKYAGYDISHFKVNKARPVRNPSKL